MMARSVVPAAALLAVVLLPAPSHAQVGPPLQPGQRLRVTAMAPGRFSGVIEGQLLKIGADSISLADSDGPAVTELPTSSITRVEVSSGRRRHTKLGLLIGAGAGILAGALVWSGLSEVGCGTEGEPFTDCPRDPAGGAVTFAVSAGLGALTGALIQTDRWVDVPVSRLRVSLAPARSSRGIAMGLTWTW